MADVAAAPFGAGFDGRGRGRGSGGAGAGAGAAAAAAGSAVGVGTKAKRGARNTPAAAGGAGGGPAPAPAAPQGFPKRRAIKGGEEELTAAEIHQIFKKEYFDKAQRINELLLMIKVADTIHDFIRGYRNKPRGVSADYVNKFIDNYIDNSGLPDDMKLFLKSKKSDIEDSMIEYFETIANLRWIGPIDMNARETHDDLLRKCPTVDKAEEYALEKREEFETYELKPGVKSIKSMNILEKAIIFAFNNTFFFGSKDAQSFIYFDGPAKRAGTIIKNSKTMRGLMMPQTLTDSAPTSFKPLTSIENLLAAPSNQPDGSFITDSNCFTKGKYIIRYVPEEGKTFTDKSRFAWTYNIEGVEDDLETVIISYGNKNGYPTEGPSVDQLLELQIKLATGGDFDVSVDKSTQLNLTEYINDLDTPNIIADISAGVSDDSETPESLLFDIKRGGDYGQVEAGDKLSDDLKYVCNSSPDRLEGLYARLVGLPSWWHNGDHFKLYRTRLRERELTPEEIAEFELNKIRRELETKREILKLFCPANSGDAAAMKAAIIAISTALDGKSDFQGAKNNDIRNYILPIAYYNIPHNECNTVFGAGTDLASLRIYNDSATQLLSKIIRNLNLFKFSIGVVEVTRFYQANIATIFTHERVIKGIELAINVIYPEGGARPDPAVLYGSILGYISTNPTAKKAYDDSKGAGKDESTSILNAVVAFIEEISMPSARAAKGAAIAEGIREDTANQYGIVALIDTAINTYIRIVSEVVSGPPSAANQLQYNNILKEINPYISDSLLLLLETNIPTSRVPYSGEFIQNLFSLIKKIHAAGEFNLGIIHNEINYSPPRATELRKLLTEITLQSGNIAGAAAGGKYVITDLLSQIDKYNKLLFTFCNTFYDQGTASTFFQSNCITTKGIDRKTIPYNIQLDGEDDDEGEDDTGVIVFNITKAVSDSFSSAFKAALVNRREKSIKDAYLVQAKVIVDAMSLPVAEGGAAGGGGGGGGGAAAGDDNLGNLGGGARRERRKVFRQHGGDLDDTDSTLFLELFEDFLYNVSVIVNENLTKDYPELSIYARKSQLDYLKENNNISFIDTEETSLVQLLKEKFPDIDEDEDEITSYDEYIKKDIQRIITEVSSADGGVFDTTKILPLYKDIVAKYYSDKSYETFKPTTLGQYFDFEAEKYISNFMFVNGIPAIKPTPAEGPKPAEGFLINMTPKKAITLTILYDIITYNAAKISIFSTLIPDIFKIASIRSDRYNITLLKLITNGQFSNFLNNINRTSLNGIKAVLSSRAFISIMNGGARRTRRRYSRRTYNRSRTHHQDRLIRVVQKQTRRHKDSGSRRRHRRTTRKNKSDE